MTHYDGDYERVESSGPREGHRDVRKRTFSVWVASPLRSRRLALFAHLLHLGELPVARLERGVGLAGQRHLDEHFALGFVEPHAHAVAAHVKHALGLSPDAASLLVLHVQLILQRVEQIARGLLVARLELAPHGVRLVRAALVANLPLRVLPAKHVVQARLRGRVGVGVVAPAVRGVGDHVRDERARHAGRAPGVPRDARPGARGRRDHPGRRAPRQRVGANRVGGRHHRVGTEVNAGRIGTARGPAGSSDA
mmetsp:Transcript_16281/g.68406  ORF Transcript_16281/g.68406 Transcript_16281/m.68406 type:complete len:252 (+) Transcript_16281:84-839(+)